MVDAQTDGAPLGRFEPLERIQMALRVASLSNDCSVEALGDLLHPELEVPSVPGVAPAEGFRGIEGFHRYFAEAERNNFLAQAAIRAARITPAGNVLAEGDLVVVFAREVEITPAWYVYRFRESRVSAIETYVSEPEALRAAG